MPRFLPWSFVALWVTGLAAAAPETPPAAKTIVIVRHAETEAEAPGSDPPLSAAGRARAVALARMLGDTPLHAVYVTPFRRNRQTAESLAQKPTVIDDVHATLSALAAEPWGATVVVVGHSNTVPAIVSSLTGRPTPENEKIGFDGMWVVTVTRDGAASLLHLHYGPP
jgi:broad specificity phosphatase PhoE